MAHILYRHGARVILACRTSDEARGTAADLRKRSPGRPADNAVALRAPCDLLSSECVRSYAAELIDAGLKPNVLVANAGIWPARFRLSADGVEAAYSTILLGHFVLINSLLPQLEAAAADAGGRPSRVVVIASTMHKVAFTRLLPARARDARGPGRGGGPSWIPAAPAPGLRVRPLSAKDFDWVQSYVQSKFALVLYTRELARRLADRGAPILANAVHPGTVLGTHIFRELLWDLSYFAGQVWNGWPLYKNPAKGAATPLYVALSPQLDSTATGTTGGGRGGSAGDRDPDGAGLGLGSQMGTSGSYFEDCNKCAPHPWVFHRELALKLWEDAEAMTGGPDVNVTPGQAPVIKTEAGRGGEPPL